MSIVTGILNKTCTAKRPVFTDDGAGGQVISSWTTLATGMDVLISQKTQTFPTLPGGRMSIETLTAYTEWTEETALNVNDVLTDVTDGAGVVETDYVNGKSTPAAYKVTGRTDPNGEHDHLELMVEHVHGREAGQP